MKVLITDKVHSVLIDGLRDIGFEVDYDTSVDNSVLEKIIGPYDGIIINSKIIMNRFRINLGTNLKFIGRLGSGLEIIDVEYAREKGIQVYNSPEGNRNAVAEHEMGMLLALHNNLLRADREVRSFSWNREKNRGKELRGKTIGIIGLGNTGASFAEKLYGWGVHVLAYDKYRTVYPANLGFVRITTLNEVIEQSDILSFHLPLTDETRYWVDDAFIRKCKDDVIISNTSRGKIIQTTALLNGLESGKIGGACLDVFENENPHFYNADEISMYTTLYTFDNVIVTPHIAGWTEESLRLIAEVLLIKIKEGFNS